MKEFTEQQLANIDGLFTSLEDLPEIDLDSPDLADAFKVQASGAAQAVVSTSPVSEDTVDQSNFQFQDDASQSVLPANLFCDEDADAWVFPELAVSGSTATPSAAATAFADAVLAPEPAVPAPAVPAPAVPVLGVNSFLFDLAGVHEIQKVMGYSNIVREPATPSRDNDVEKNAAESKSAPSTHNPTSRSLSRLACVAYLPASPGTRAQQKREQTAFEAALRESLRDLPAEPATPIANRTRGAGRK